MSPRIPLNNKFVTFDGTGFAADQEEIFQMAKLGGPPETRTPDPLIKSQLLYQLS
jgi:hypothetical protein